MWNITFRCLLSFVECQLSATLSNLSLNGIALDPDYMLFWKHKFYLFGYHLGLIRYNHAYISKSIIALLFNWIFIFSGKLEMLTALLILQVLSEFLCCLSFHFYILFYNYRKCAVWKQILSSLSRIFSGYISSNT